MSIRSAIIGAVIAVISLAPVFARGGGGHGFVGGHSGRSSSASTVQVRGYVTRNGTYVAPHYRTAPDHDFYNNWSTAGNFNPFTGKAGTKTLPSGYRSVGGPPFWATTHPTLAANLQYSASAAPASYLPQSATENRPDPKDALHTYYGLISQKRNDEAFGMRSSRSQASTSRDEFLKVWGNNLGIRLDKAAILSSDAARAILGVRLISCDRPSPASLPKVTAFVGTVKLAYENGVWRYDGAEVYAEP